MPIKPVDTRMVGGKSPLVLTDSYLTNLTSVNVSSTNVFTGNLYVNNTLKNTVWDSTFTTVQSNSATTWNYQGTDLKALSGNWQTAYNIATTYNNISSAFTTQSLSSRFINLEHSTPNDGINPVLFIGERGDGSGGTVTGSLSGFNITYNEIGNDLTVTTQFGAVAPITAVDINSNGFVGINCNPNQTLTVNGNISATGVINAANTNLYVYNANIVTGNANNNVGVPIISSLALNANTLYKVSGFTSCSNIGALLFNYNGTLASGCLTLTQSLSNNSVAGQGVNRVTSYFNTPQTGAFTLAGGNITPSNGGNTLLIKSSSTINSTVFTIDCILSTSTSGTIGLSSVNVASGIAPLFQNTFLQATPLY